MSTPAEERGDLLVRFLWKHQTDCILDVRTTAQSNIHWKLEAVFLSHEREKKKSYFQACLYQRLLLSLCGFMWWSAWQWSQGTVVLQNVAGSLAKISGKFYSETSNFMKSRWALQLYEPHIYSIFVYRIRGSRIPTMSRMSQYSQWEDGAGLIMFHVVEFSGKN